MRGATRINNTFWMCKRPKQFFVEELINWDEVQANYDRFRLEQAKNDAKKMVELWIISFQDKKKESLKKRIFRRFLPWKEPQK